MVLLDNKLEISTAFVLLAGGLGSFIELSFGLIFFERHLIPLVVIPTLPEGSN
jgi:hypothetical protein